MANPNFELYECDFLSEADISYGLMDCDGSFLTTLPKSFNADPAFDVESNVLGSVRLFTHAVKSELKKIILT